MRPSYCLKAKSYAVFETSYGVPTGEKGSPKTQQHQVSALALGCCSKLETSHFKSVWSFVKCRKRFVGLQEQSFKTHVAYLGLTAGPEPKMNGKATNG